MNYEKIEKESKDQEVEKDPYVDKPLPVRRITRGRKGGWRCMPPTYRKRRRNSQSL